MTSQEQKDRRDRLDRLVIAFGSHSLKGGGAVDKPEAFSKYIVDLAEAVLAELERREKEQSK